MTRLGSSSMLALALAAVAPSVALANGRPPATLSIAFRPGHAEDVIVGTTFGSLWSRDHGATWSWLCEAAVGDGGIDEARWTWLEDGTVLAATGSGLSVARGDACDWAVASGTEERLVTDIAVHPDEPGTVLVTVAGRTNEILRSVDAARTFHESVYDARDAFLVGARMSAGSPGHIYAASIAYLERTASVLHSSDGGATWDEWPFTASTAHEIVLHAIDPSSPAVVFVSITDALFRSDDFGRSFQPVLTADGEIRAFVMSAGGDRAWVAAGYGGVYRSDDGGRSFSAMVGAPHADCLVREGEALHACASSALDGHVLARSSGGEAFDPTMTWFDEVGGPLCPAGTAVGDDVSCDLEWRALEARFDSERPDAGLETPEAGLEPGGGGCACASSSGASGVTLGLLALAVAWFARVRRGRKG